VLTQCGSPSAAFARNCAEARTISALFTLVRTECFWDTPVQLPNHQSKCLNEAILEYCCSAFLCRTTSSCRCFTTGSPLGSPWRRLLALFVNALLLGIVSGVMCIPFFEQLSRLGPWGRLIGFCIALPYFAILESRIGNGRTLGKRWMHLQVVDGHGNTISLGKSLLRSSLFAIPLFVNGLELPVTRTPWIVSSILSVLIFGLGGSTLYLLLFNRRTRQGINDLALGSYVTKANETGPLNRQAIWNTHWVISPRAIGFLRDGRRNCRH
jgi:uncharacterized RDD family membrane protein YckC